MLPCLGDKSIHLIIKESILEGVQPSSPEFTVFDGLLDPLLVGVFLVSAIMGKKGTGMAYNCRPVSFLLINLGHADLQSQDCVIGNVLDEIGIRDSVTSLRQVRVTFTTGPGYYTHLREPHEQRLHRISSRPATRH